jgi:F-type H+-transporting ATPase subunit b
MSRVALPRISQVLEERQTRIAHDFDEAERLKKAADKAIAEYEAALVGARAKAQAVTVANRQKLADAAAAARAEREARLAENARRAEASIMAAKNAAIGGLANAASDIARTVVERLLGGMPQSDHLAQATRDAVAKVLAERR